jgi:hypothetical protein
MSRTPLAAALIKKGWDKDVLAGNGWIFQVTEDNAPSLLRFASRGYPSLVLALLENGVCPVGKNMGFGLGRIDIGNPALHLGGFGLVGPLLDAGWVPFPNPTPKEGGLLTRVVEMANAALERKKHLPENAAKTLPLFAEAVASIMTHKWPGRRIDTVQAFIAAATAPRHAAALVEILFETGLTLDSEQEKDRVIAAATTDDRYRRTPVEPVLRVGFDRVALETLPPAPPAPRPLRL